MNYDTENWVKLYVRESTEDRCLPVFNRALRDFLLRFAKSRNDGTILRKTNRPTEDLARALGAHPTELPVMVGYIDSMLEDGYLTHEGGRLWITNFVAAQELRSAGAIRQQRWRDSKRVTQAQPETSPGVSDPSPISVTSNVTRDTNSNANAASPGDVTGASHDTLQTIRDDPNRSDLKPPASSGSDRSGARGPEPSPTPPYEREHPEAVERETVCPLDLLQRDGVRVAIREIAENLGCSLDSLEAESREFLSYWTIGKGMGRKKLNWPKELRERLRRQYHSGSLAPPGAVLHAGRVRGRPEPENVPTRRISAATAQILGPGLVKVLERRGGLS